MQLPICFGIKNTSHFASHEMYFYLLTISKLLKLIRTKQFLDITDNFRNAINTINGNDQFH